MRELRHPRDVYAQLMALLARLAAKGLIHCDFNEFNLLARACVACSAGFLHNARSKQGDAAPDIACFVAFLGDLGFFTPLLCLTSLHAPCGAGIWPHRVVPRTTAES